MSLKQIQKLMEKLEDALQDVEIDLDSAVEERNDYKFRLAEKTEELELMEDVNVNEYLTHMLINT